MLTEALSREHDRPGFTLIEVLVVVAIIALLIAILLPSLQLARAQTKKTACAANLHDLGQAFTMYAGASNEYYPLTRHPADDSLLTLYKARLLPNLKVLVCPETKHVVRPQTLNRTPGIGYSMQVPSIPVPVITPKSDIEKCASGGPNDSSGGMSYEYQGMYGPYVGGAAVGKNLSLHHKRANTFIFPPYQMMLVIEADDGWTGDPTGCRGSINGAVDGNNCPQPWDNHGKDGMNLMYADGHSQWERKVAGIRKYDQYGLLQQSKWTPDQNLSIDMIWLKSDWPWIFKP